MGHIDFAFYTDIGGRTDNEDAYCNKILDDGYLFAVADGLGGHKGGEIASGTAIRTIEKYFTETESRNIAESVELANNQVLNMQKETATGMKTTISAVFAGENETVIAYVGDSRVYAFKDGKIVFQTKDHSASQLAVSVGEIEKDEIRNHPDRNVLTRALGVSDEVKVEVVTLQNSEYDALLLCTDGFWEYVLEEEMEETLCSCQSANNWLYKMRIIQLNKASEDCDNNTAIVVVKQNLKIKCD